MLKTRGINDGDYVNVYNDRGSTVVKAIFNPGVRPGSVNIPHGWQRDQSKAGGYQELTSSVTNPISLSFAYNDIMVEVSKLSSSTALNPHVYPLGKGGNDTQMSANATSRLPVTTTAKARRRDWDWLLTSGVVSVAGLAAWVASL